ncbi:MAG: caspase family protein [Planctomycetota bacterium]
MADPKKALLIGINSYDQLPTLSACVRDAEAMALALFRHDDGTHEMNYECTVLKDAAANGGRLTRAELRRAITDHFKDFKGDTLLYFSGHATLTPTGGFLAARDSEKNDPGVAMHEVMTLATKAPAREVVIILDCCHAGDAGNAAALGKTALGESLTVLREELTVIAAAGSAQAAIEVNGRSEFTAALVDALNGGAADALGQVTAPAMYAYARRRFGPTTQRPVYKSHATDATVIRRCKRLIERPELQRLVQLFRTTNDRIRLDPEYEPEDEHGNKKQPVNEEKVKDAQLFKRFRDAGLVRSTDGEHFYWTARWGRTLELSDRGKEYWVLISKGRI